jgi:hypothetical protein
VRRGSLFLLFTAMMVAIVVLALRLRDEQGPLDAEAVAVELVDDGIAQDSRREDDLWEVRIQNGGQGQLEVELDRNYRLVEVDDEALGDE